jgi:hypothetical protein
VDALSAGQGVDMGSDGSRLPSAITTSDCMPSHKKTTKTQNTNALTKASDQRQSRKLMATDYIDFQGTKGVPRRDQMCLMTTLRPQPWYDDVGCRRFQVALRYSYIAIRSKALVALDARLLHCGGG